MNTLHKSRSRYPEALVNPMRQEVIDAGLVEWRTAEEIEQNLALPGTTFIFINSVCGCSAGNARPAIRMIMKHKNLPQRMATCFAGVDIEAVARLRQNITQYPPSSPSIALFKDGELVYFMPRHVIKSQAPEDIAETLRQVFDQYCI